MESLTKNRQSFDTLQRLVARGFGENQVPATADAVTELGAGWFNIAYKIRLEDGTTTVLKVAPAIEVLSHEVNAMATEWAAIDLIQRETDVPVAPVLFKDDTLELIDVPYFFMPYIEGDDLGIIGDALSKEDEAHYTEQTGALNYKLNQIVGPGFGPILNPIHTTWTAAYREFFEASLQDGIRRDVDLCGFSYETMREIFEAHVPFLNEVTEPRYVEQDMWPKAVIFKDGKPLAHIDHERAIFGDPIIEGGFVFLDIPAFGDGPAFLRGYGKEGLTENEAKRRLLYTLHLAIIMVVESEYRGFDEPGHLDFVNNNLRETMQKFGF